MTTPIPYASAAPEPPDVPRVPVAPGERATTIDALRGVAILGILLLNIRAFALPGDAYVHPFVIEPGPGDLLAYALTTAFAQGKFIAIFAALYGAGIVLSTRRRDEAGAAGAASFPVFLRRSIILAGVGLAHMFLIWSGDILFLYAGLGLIAYTMRRWPTWGLWLMAAGLFVLSVGLSLLLALGLWAAATFDDADPSLTPAQRAADLVLDPASWQAETAAMTGGYLDALAHRAPATLAFQIGALILYGPGVLALMLAGMALLRGGFLTGGWSAGHYALAAVFGLAVGWGGSALVTYLGWQGGFTPIYWMAFAQALLELLAPAAALGIAAAVIALARRGPLAAVFAPVGRMAFTNYLTQSIICTLIFNGYGLGHFGTLGYADQLWVVAGVWAVQIAWSHLWLRRFRFGPLEWLWRGATYGALPALRKAA